MSKLSVILFSILPALVAGKCSVHDIPHLQVTAVDRCCQIQECINKAFDNDRNNPYILDKLFRNTQSRPPVALIVTYNVTAAVTSNDTNSDEDGSSHWSGSGSGIDEILFDASINDSTVSNVTTSVKPGGHEPSKQINYIEQIGWSSTGIYSAIRPMVLVSLQPALYWWALSFAIDDYGLPKSIQFALDISECYGEGVIQQEVKEALEHLTMKVNLSYYLPHVGVNSCRGTRRQFSGCPVTYLVSCSHYILEFCSAAQFLQHTGAMTYVMTIV